MQAASAPQEVREPSRAQSQVERSAQATGLEQLDPRDSYDVSAYRLDLTLDPERELLFGTAYTAAQILRGPLKSIALDLSNDFSVQRVGVTDAALDGRSKLETREVSFRHALDRLEVELPAALQEGETITLAIRYSGHPQVLDEFTGIHFERTESGQAWINTSVQNFGSHMWWPGKASRFNPEDKPERVFLNYTVPSGLVAVGNGKFTGKSSPRPGWDSFHWDHPYALETYAISLNVGPFVIIESPLELSEGPSPVTSMIFVLPEDEEKARLQFSDLNYLIDTFAQYFGPWPFPEAKVGIVQTNFWGMEHSTAIAYGSSFPAWRKLHGKPDPWAFRNKYFDYILVHEMAHEWWGNSVSTADWGHFWIHEGFATYAESLFVEHTYGREKADEYLALTRSMIADDSRLFRGRDVDADKAYGSVIYLKGAWVLNTLRHYLDDDEIWFACLREFNLAHRNGNVLTEDFQRVLERLSERNWQQFFDEWFYGIGYPTLKGSISSLGRTIMVDVDNPIRHGTPFHVPLDVSWEESGIRMKKRVPLEPGPNAIRIGCAAPPSHIRIEHLERVLGKHEVVVIKSIDR